MSNLERFLVATAPCVHVDPATSGAAFRLPELWQSLEDWSAYGAAVPLVLEGGQEVSQYYAPSLSAVQLYAALPAGSAADAAPRLLFEFFERAPPFARKPLSDTLSDLTAGGAGAALGTLSSAELHARSFLAVCWQPICRIPLGSVFREVSATFITYHQLRVGADDALPASCPVTVREALRERGATQCGGAAALLPAFGLLALKLDAEQWLAGGEPRLVADLAAACASWMAPLAGKHSDFEFYRAQGAAGS